jgi:hypothetical protein
VVRGSRSDVLAVADHEKPLLSPASLCHAQKQTALWGRAEGGSHSQCDCFGEGDSDGTFSPAWWFPRWTPAACFAGLEAAEGGQATGILLDGSQRAPRRPAPLFQVFSWRRWLAVAQ